MKLGINRYPEIKKAWKSRNKSPINKSYLSKLFPKTNGYDFGLTDINKYLKIILNKYPISELDEVVDNLFSNSEGKFTNAFEELSVFHLILSRKIKLYLGKSIFPKGSPPFEGRISIGRKKIDFDVKSASSGGLRLLTEKLRKSLDSISWYKQSNTKFSIRHFGRLNQSDVGRIMSSGSYRSFLNQVSTNQNGNNGIFTIKDGNLEIQVKLSKKASTDFGMAGVTRKHDDLKTRVLQNLNSKMNNSVKTGLPFLLVFVQLPGRGDTDFRENDFEDVMKLVVSDQNLLRNPASSNWLGAWYFDLNTYPKKVLVYHRLPIFKANFIDESRLKIKIQK